MLNEIKELNKLLEEYNKINKFLEIHTIENKERSEIIKIAELLRKVIIEFCNSLLMPVEITPSIDEQVKEFYRKLANENNKKGQVKQDI